VDNFKATRRHLKGRVGDLVEQAAAEQKDARAHDDLALLTKTGWIPGRPLPLDSVELRLREATAGESLDPARAQVRAGLPQVESYSEAIGRFDPPNIWFDSPSYRLMGVEPTADGVRLEFALARYFDGQDTTAYLEYELADRHARGEAQITVGPYRTWLGDPFDLGRRCGLTGISALTVRRSPGDAFFFMHRRDPAQVATAMNTTHVTPAGEFQPYSDAPSVLRSDLRLWHSVMREYTEEFLGLPEVTGSGGSVDYADDVPYKHFTNARRNGDVQVHFLGIGLDPLTWKPELCLVCVWDAPAFDEIFRAMVGHNEEGLLITGEEGDRGMRFTAENVLAYAGEPTTLPTARACLKLAWQWREELGIPAK
jgi:hypothetical protein